MKEPLRRSKETKSLRRKKKPQYQKQMPDYEKYLASSEGLTRKEAKQEMQQLDEEFKTKRLAKRLNWAIVILVILIVLVYLFMFFVNF